MKYNYPTTSKPVTGAMADAIVKAVDSGNHIASPRALEVMKRLFEKNRTRKTEASHHGQRKQVRGR